MSSLVYFAHSYRPRDALANDYFARLMEAEGFIASLDPPSTNVNSAKLERHLGNCDAMVVVLTERESGVSQHILYEIGLGIRSGKPMLVFVEDTLPTDTVPGRPLVATICTPQAAPVIAATRLRAGKAGPSRGAASMVAEAITAARAAGAAGEIIVRGDAAFYAAKLISTCRRARVRFSVTVPITRAIRAAIATIGEDAWVDIKYPHAIFDEDEGRWISDAQIAETTYTAFAGTRHETTARLIVRRVKRLNPKADQGQDELFTLWRHHALFTDSRHVLVQAEAQHRGHAIIEQCFAEIIDGPLAHLPSGQFGANAAWLSLTALAHNLTRAAGCLASRHHALARPATIRRHLVHIGARIAHRARKIILHLPEQWPWQPAWQQLFTAVHTAPT